MAKDSTDRQINGGDRVSLVGQIFRITGSENGANVTVRIDAPPGEYSPEIALNSRCVTSLEPLPTDESNQSEDASLATQSSTTGEATDPPSDPAASTPPPAAA